jgi:hypothetical protein
MIKLKIKSIKKYIKRKHSGQLEFTQLNLDLGYEIGKTTHKENQKQ